MARRHTDRPSSRYTLIHRSRTVCRSVSLSAAPSSAITCRFVSPSVISVSMLSAAYRLMGEYTRFSLSAKILPSVLLAKANTAPPSGSASSLPSFCSASRYSVYAAS